MAGNGVRAHDVFGEINGALLFGESSFLDLKKLELSSLPVVHMEGSLYDGEPGSSQQTSYKSNSATTSSGVMRSDSHSAQSSTESTRTSLSPALAPVILNEFPDHRQALPQLPRKKGDIISGLREKLDGMRSSRWKIIFKATES